MSGPKTLILFLIVVPVLLLVAAAVLVPLFLDKDKVLAIAATALQEKTGAILVVDGETSLSLYPGIGVSLADAAVTMPGKQQPDFRARALEIGVQLMPLFSGNVEIDSIRLDGLSARIEPAAEADGADSRKLSDQELDEFYAARRKAMAEAGEVAGAETVLAVPLALDIKSMEITDSRLELIDTAQALRYQRPRVQQVAVGRHDFERGIEHFERFLITARLPQKLAPVSYTHLTLPTTRQRCRSRWSPYH